MDAGGPVGMPGLVDLLTPLGLAPVQVRPVPGGDTGRAARVRLADGRSVFAKAVPGAPPRLVSVEARGLADLAAAGGVLVPGVLAVGPGLIVLDWVETGSPGRPAAEAFGRSLARTHAAGAPAFGRLDGDGFIGPLPLPCGPYAGWPELYAQGRVRPYLRAARDSGALGRRDAADVERVLDRLADLPGAGGRPALVHGDLWAGNVLWGTDGVVRVVDPACHGGHREADLAMLALFGCPHLDTVLGAYAEEAGPALAAGWRERRAVHQLHPVLVHAVLFGGGYGRQAGELARAALRTA